VTPAPGPAVLKPTLENRETLARSRHKKKGEQDVRRVSAEKGGFIRNKDTMVCFERGARSEKKIR